jgi:hypothetical protein
MYLMHGNAACPKLTVNLSFDAYLENEYNVDRDLLNPIVTDCSEFHKEDQIVVLTNKILQLFAVD